MKLQATILTLVAALMFGGCAIVHIDSADGRTTVQKHFGVLGIKVEPAKGTQVVEATGVGLTVMQNSMTLGYQDVNTVQLGRDCLAAFIINNKEQLLNAEKVAREVSSVCAVDGDSRFKQEEKL